MVTGLNSQIGGMTASIEFMGEEVGELQNVGWDESTNIVKVNAIGSPINVAHIVGGTEYTVTASRALLHGDIMITLLQAALSRQAVLDVTGTTQIGGDDGAIQYAKDNGLTLQNVYDALVGNGSVAASDAALSYTSGNQTRGKPIGLTFDVVIKDIDGIGVFQFSECVMQSKRHRLDATGIIVTQDVTLLSRKKLPLKNSLIIAEANPSL